MGSPFEHQVATVLTILKEGMAKLKISLILPQIFENPKMLYEYLKGTSYDDCWPMVMEYSEQMKHSPLDTSTKLYYSIIKILDYFHENVQILQILPNCLENIDNIEETILLSYEKVYKLAQQHFNSKALLVLANEKRMHEIYLANEEVKRNIQDVLHKIHKRKFNRMWKSTAKSAVIKSLEDELALDQLNSKMRVNQEISKSNREMEKLIAAFATKQRDLDEEFEKVYFKYENQLKFNLKQEKNARDEKNKYQLQLQALIRKYDQTMFDKFQEERQLNEEYDKLKLEFDQFMLDYQQEYDLYDKQVLQKEVEYERQHRARICSFTDNLAARRIQHWWKKCKREEKRKNQLKRSKNLKGKPPGIGLKGRDNEVKNGGSKITKTGNKGQKK